ncbi:hypothetical protein AAMO2058_000489100 [Amorphochlora amoebiformis]
MGTMLGLLTFEEEIPRMMKAAVYGLLPILTVGMSQSAIRGELFDFKGQVRFYMSYHMDPINILIHIPFVPTIMWSAFGMLATTAPLVKGAPKWCDMSLPIAVIYAAYYAVMGKKLSPAFAITAVSLVLAMFASVHIFHLPANVYGIIHIASWIMQFYGHAIHERRAPALLNNISQAFLMAPLFVLFEVAHGFGFFRKQMKEIKEGLKPVKLS